MEMKKAHRQSVVANSLHCRIGSQNFGFVVHAQLCCMSPICRKLMPSVLGSGVVRKEDVPSPTVSSGEDFE